MNKYGYLLFLLFFVTNNTLCQKKSFKLIKSTITSAGSSNFQLPQKKISVLQSIGQSGIVGKSEFNKTIIQQGFLTNTKYFSIDNSNVVNFEERFDVVVSPNPFIDYIKIDFSSKTKHPINIRIYDISGKTYIYKTYNASESILLPMKNFSLGNYIVHIVSGKNKYIKKIFKAQ